jgi:hypothetical protein
MLLGMLTPEQRTQLAQALEEQQPASPADTAVAESSSYYNMDEAVEVKFKADLQPNAKSRDASFSEKYDHVWSIGHYRVRGPRGGVYFVGRCVLGVRKGQQVKGTLRVGNRYFEEFLQGAPLDAWFRPDGVREPVLIGTLVNYRAA